MSDDVSAVRKVIGVEEHAWTAGLRDALVKFGGDDTVTMMSAQAGIDRRLLDVGDCNAISTQNEGGSHDPVRHGDH